MKIVRAWIDIGHDYWDREARSYGPVGDEGLAGIDHDQAILDLWSRETDRGQATQQITKPGSQSWTPKQAGPNAGPVSDDEIPF